MNVGDVRVSPSWLALREPADAAARAIDLVDMLRSILPGDRRLAIHDLGSGTGSMLRWLAPRLDAPQHWVMYDRDVALLELAASHAPPTGPTGDVTTVEVRQRDITRLQPDDLDGASLVTASALLDMFTADELSRFVATCAAAHCPVLITLTVVGRVEITPPDPLDEAIESAFNAHQRRTAEGRQLLGPDAGDAATAAFAALGGDVVVHPSPWRLGPHSSPLAAEWLAGWVGAAVEQQSGLAGPSDGYLRRRLDDLDAGHLMVTVHHDDLLAVPR